MGLRYKAAIVGLGRIATMIDDEVVNAGSPRHVLPMSHMGSYIDVQEVDFCRRGRSLQRTTGCIC